MSPNEKPETSDFIRLSRAFSCKRKEEKGWNLLGFGDTRVIF